MADKQEARRKLQLLAGRVQGRITTYSEDVRLDRALEGKELNTKDDVRKILEEGLQKNAAEISTQLASHDDSDRLIDDVIQALKKK
jgi:hypothetical protein